MKEEPLLSEKNGVQLCLDPKKFISKPVTSNVWTHV